MQASEIHQFEFVFLLLLVFVFGFGTLAQRLKTPTTARLLFCKQDWQQCSTQGRDSTFQLLRAQRPEYQTISAASARTVDRLYLLILSRAPPGRIPDISRPDTIAEAA